MVERTSKCLTQRSRPNIAQIITIDELCSMAKIVDLLNQESMRMTNRVSNGLALSLQVCILSTVWKNKKISFTEKYFVKTTL